MISLQINPSPASYEDSLLCPAIVMDLGSVISSNNRELHSSEMRGENSKTDSSTKIDEKNIKLNRKRKLQQKGSEKLNVRENVQGVRDRVLLTVLTRAVDDSGWVEGAGESSTSTSASASTSTSTSSTLTPHFIQIVL